MVSNSSRHLIRIVPRWIVLPLAIALVVAVWLPAAAYAQKPNTALQAATLQEQAVGSSSDLTTQAVEKYPIWVGNKQVTSKNAKNILGNGTASYNAKTNTLTLKNAKIKKAHVEKSSKDKTWRSGIFARQSQGLTIVLKGTNKISVPGSATVASYGIDMTTPSGDQSNLTIKGSGSLQVNAGKAGLFSFGLLCENLNIMGSAKVTARGGTMVKTSQKANDSISSSVGSYGVYVTGLLALGDSAKLTASGKTKALNRSASYFQNYTAQVKAGASAKKLKMNKKNPASSVYTKYKYVSISKAKATSKKPAKMAITKITPLASGLSVEYKPLSKNCTGYQLELVSISSGKKWTYNTTSTKMDKATLTNLSGGAKYSVRIRAFNKVGSKTYYGSWSSKKSTTTYSGQPAG